MYATLYCSYHKETQLTYLPYIEYYGRLIDDAFVIVDENTPFTHLESNMNAFGPAEKKAHMGHRATPPYS